MRCGYRQLGGIVDYPAEDQCWAGPTFLIVARQCEPRGIRQPRSGLSRKYRISTLGGAKISLARSFPRPIASRLKTQGLKHSLLFDCTSDNGPRCAKRGNHWVIEAHDSEDGCARKTARIIAPTDCRTDSAHHSQKCVNCYGGDSSAATYALKTQ